MFDLESSIKKWLAEFSKHRAFDHGEIHEMELHLRDHIDDKISEGATEQEAFDAAVSEFGEIPQMAEEEFSNIRRKRTIRSILFTSMLNNYYKTSFRSLMKHPLSSFINIFGLAAAIGICVFTYSFAAYINGADQFHQNKDKVYLATFFADRDGTLQQNGMTPRPLGQMLREDFTQVKKVCRIDDRNVVLKHGDKVFHERVRYVDPEFLELFTFPLKWGLESALEDLNSIILSHDMSVKYFGDENPIGQTVLMKFDEVQRKTFEVAGVAAPFPDTHIISFDFLINFDNFQTSEPGYDLADWSAFVNATLIMVDEPADLAPIEQGMEKYRLLQNKVRNDWAIQSFEFEQLETLYKNSSDIRNGISSNAYNDNFTGVIMISVVTLILLLLACFNYINISIVSAAKRLKEIGLRKVIGASRRMMITQFLTENIFITLFALVLGLIFGVMVINPWFERLWNFSMGFSLFDGYLWVYLAFVLVFTGVVSGIYPALYISKFQVVGILRGTVKFGKKNPLTKVLLGIQLILACMIITSAVMFTQNNKYIANRSWGYDQSEALYTGVHSAAAFDQLRMSMTQSPNVLSVSGSVHHLGRNNETTVIDLIDRQYEVDQLSIEPNYFETMGLQIISGRSFKSHYASDKKAVVVNEQLIGNTSLTEPVGKFLKIDSINYEIIGIVKDFHMRNFSDEVVPTLFMVADEEDYNYLSMRVRNGAEKQTYKELRAAWIELFSEIPFQGGYQADVWGGYFEEIGIHGKVWRGLAFIAILLASLGLYGLVRLNVSGRFREFSIRKVLGADEKNIATNIVRNYSILFLVSLLIGAPVSYICVDRLIEFSYPYHIPMNSSGVGISTMILILILLITVFTQVMKIARSNPVVGLKVE